jgi:hypothetical protein
MGGKLKAILLVSETLRRMSDVLPPMQIVAGSLYCEARKAA